MPTAGKVFEQSYNAQIAVDAKQQMIVAATVCQTAGDYGQLLPVLDAACCNTATTPRCVLADAGYKVERDLRTIEERGIDAYVAIGREGKSTRHVSAKSPHTRAMQRKLATKRGRARYRRRKAIVEPVFGWVKRVLGFRAFSMRGLRKVAGEWSLVCLALNLRRMATQGVAW